MLVIPTKSVALFTFIEWTFGKVEELDKIFDDKDLALSLTEILRDSCHFPLEFFQKLNSGYHVIRKTCNS